jgi:NADPH:quinone reductase-like Zn-dependent oxidoreductase
MMDLNPLDRMYGSEGMGGAPDPTSTAWLVQRQLELLERQQRINEHHAHVHEVIQQQMAMLPSKVLHEIIDEYMAMRQAPKKTRWFSWFK